MKPLLVGIALMAFMVGCLVGQSNRPEDVDQRERAVRLQKAYWDMLGAHGRAVDPEE